MRINQLYPHAPANLEEVKEILGERWIKDGDVCFSRAQIDNMKSNLGRHQSDNPSNVSEMLRMNKDLIIQQRKIMIDLNLVSPAHMEYLEIYAKKNYNIVLNMKAKL